MSRERRDAPELVRSASRILGARSTRTKLARRERAGFGQTAQRRIATLGADEKSARDISAISVLLGSDRLHFAGPFEGNLHIGECSCIETVGNHFPLLDVLE
jgi:hypothetical protein